MAIQQLAFSLEETQLDEKLSSLPLASIEYNAKMDRYYARTLDPLSTVIQRMWEGGYFSPPQSEVEVRAKLHDWHIVPSETLNAIAVARLQAIDDYYATCSMTIEEKLNKLSVVWR